MNEPTLEAYCICLQVLRYFRTAYAETDYDNIVALLELRCGEYERQRAEQEQAGLRRQEEEEQRRLRND